LKRSYILSLVLLVTLPIIGLAFLGWRMLDGERARLRENFTQVMQQRLAEVNTTLAETMERTERRLADTLNLTEYGVETLRGISRTHPMVSQVFMIDGVGKRTFPPAPELCSNEEREFLERSAEIWKSGERLDRAAGEHGQPLIYGWKVWYHGGGTRCWFWLRQSSGALVGAEVPSAVLMAELVNALPNSADSTAAFKLTDAQGQEIYGWGQANEPVVQVTTNAPPQLAGWKVTCSMPDVVLQGSQAWRYQLLIGITCATLVLGLVAWYLYRESAREIRQAGQRVSFVNQVSHELKTPLTNISLYAELAAQKLPAEATDVHECLEIVTSESARLGRLISNVLSFSKHQRGQIQPHPASCDVVALLRRIVEQFRPALNNKQLRLEVEMPPVLIAITDADILEQIVGNLLSNVEKYAADGGVAWLRLNSVETKFSIVVEDRGPGVPQSQRDKIFDPFVRLSDKLSDGITGTGIGLSIARELTQLLGGTLCCETPGSGHGASFILTLPLK
jgi:signal transduction histidine kinase